MIDIYQCDDCGLWHLSLNGIDVLRANDKGICLRQARIFEHCRNIPYRNAIRALMDEIGFSEETAKSIYMQLTSDRATGTVN